MSTEIDTLSTSTAGATLSTLSRNVVEAESPSPSLAVIVTVCDSSGPSDVANDQLHVPSRLSVTVPTDAVKLPDPNPATVPVLVATCPSLTITPGRSAATVGIVLTLSPNVTLATAASLSVAEMVTVCRPAACPVVSHDQPHVPSKLSVTVPCDADKATVSAPTSPNVPLLVATSPASAFSVRISTVMSGTTLLTVNKKSSDEVSPTPSVAVIVTVCESSGPSVVVKLQLQVPSRLSVTTPADAVRLPVPRSETVPEFMAAWPSSELTVARSTVSVGPELDGVIVIDWLAELSGAPLILGSSTSTTMSSVGLPAASSKVPADK